MIRSFKDSRTERLFHGEEVREFQAFARQAEKRLRILDAADTWFGTGPQLWLNLQQAYNLDLARQQLGEELEAIEPRIPVAVNA